MLVMETIAKIRRRHLVNGESISAIARSGNADENLDYFGGSPCTRPHPRCITLQPLLTKSKD